MLADLGASLPLTDELAEAVSTLTRARFAPTSTTGPHDTICRS